MNPYLIVVGAVILAWVGPLHLGRIFLAASRAGHSVGAFDATTIYFTVGVGLLVGGLL